MKRFLFVLILGLPMLCFSQSNFKEGYIVKNNQDTLKGYINFKELNLNPVSLEFRSSKSAQTQMFDLESCSAFGIDREEVYRRFTVNVSQSSTHTEGLSLVEDTTSLRKKVFLKVLALGKNVNLFTYEDEIKRRFYLLENGQNEPYELIKNVYLDSRKANTIVNDKRYIQQLWSASQRYDVNNVRGVGRFKSLDYNAGDLAKIVALINEETIVKFKDKKDLRFFIGTGLSISKAAYKENSEVPKVSTDGKSSLMPFLTIGADLFANSVMKKIVFRAEMSFFISKYDISANTPLPSKTFVSNTFNQYSVALSPQLIYSFYKSPEFQAFAGAGLRFSISKYSNSVSGRVSYPLPIKYTENEARLDPFNFSLPFKAGVILKNRFEISAGYVLPSVVGNSASFHLTTQRITAGVNYLFDKK